MYMMTDITEWKRIEAELHDIPRRILQAHETERQAIARELHDEAGQSLTYITLLLDRITRVPNEEAKNIILEVGEVTRKVLGQIRNLSLNLQPGNLEHLGLTETLALHFGDYTSKTEIEVHFYFSGDPDKVPYHLALTIYRICQEALTNVARHAGVREASVYLHKDTGVVRVLIKDAGSGFNPGTDKKDSFGIVGMRERARVLGGSLEIVSSPGRGTLVTAELPLKSARH